MHMRISKLAIFCKCHNFEVKHYVLRSAIQRRNNIYLLACSLPSEVSLGSNEQLWHLKRSNQNTLENFPHPFLLYLNQNCSIFLVFTTCLATDRQTHRQIKVSAFQAFFRCAVNLLRWAFNTENKNVKSSF